MNSSHLNLLTTSATVALALTFSVTASARSNSHPDRDRATADRRIESPDHVRRASHDDANRTIDHLTGAELRDRDGKAIGKIKDFLVDANTGRVDFAVVSVGGFAGIGDKLHLVPFAMLDEPAEDRDHHGFSAAITGQELEQSPVINDDDFEHDRLAVDQAEQQRILAAFPSTIPNAGAGIGPSAALVRATKLHGRDVEANGDKVGRVDGVVIERGSLRALALLKPRKGSDKVLVPFDRLKIDRNSKHAITTSVSPELFETTGPQPTGFTSAEQNTGVDSTIAADRAVVGEARSIRRALDKDSTLAHARVQVTPENNRVLVHGTVPSDDEKNAVMHTANDAAPNANIDFELNVRNR